MKLLTQQEAQALLCMLSCAPEGSSVQVAGVGADRTLMFRREHDGKVSIESWIAFCDVARNHYVRQDATTPKPERYENIKAFSKAYQLFTEDPQ